MKRRDFIRGCAVAGGGLALSGFGGIGTSYQTPKSLWRRASKNSKRVMVIGIDGMDPGLAAEMMKNGELPHFEKLAKRGHFGPLQTTLPPQSPVAW